MNTIKHKINNKNNPDDNSKSIHEMVRASYQDIAGGKGRDYNEVFDELKEKYSLEQE